MIKVFLWVSFFVEGEWSTSSHYPPTQVPNFEVCEEHRKKWGHFFTETSKTPFVLVCSETDNLEEVLVDMGLMKFGVSI